MIVYTQIKECVKCGAKATDEFSGRCDSHPTRNTWRMNNWKKRKANLDNQAGEE